MKINRVKSVNYSYNLDRKGKVFHKSDFLHVIQNIGCWIQNSNRLVAMGACPGDNLILQVPPPLVLCSTTMTACRYKLLF